MNDRNKPDNDRNITYPDDAPAYQHDYHGYRRFSRASENGCETMGIREQEVKQGNGMGLCNAKRDDVGIAVKSGD